MSIPPPGPHKRYLGDGVYVDLGDQGVILTTENGLAITNEIVLEPEGLTNLIAYLKAKRVLS